MALTGNWDDYGGKQQYVTWSKAAGGSPPSNDTAFFVDPLARTFYKAFVKALVLRRNTLTGVLYRDDPTIFGWELINEPRVYSDPSGDVLQAWVTEMAAYVKTLDPHHLLSIGSEGFYGPSTPARAAQLNAEPWMATVGTDFIRNHRVPGIDIASVHVYANSRYSAPTWPAKLAYFRAFVQGHIDDGDNVLRMPVVMGEFGPDGVKTPDGTLARRDAVYRAMYDIMLTSARKKGAGAASMFWQLMVDNLKSWDDGIAVFASSELSTVAIIANQSAAIRSLGG
eukprot:TRINITY_DN35194_c0_g1_i3.p1 TRINITY_DN35194_c0_g1~~TRINITY_DN35194_c0_g1_i3.p1  ORF type:complete len:282 (+),score=18.43 TRINITY_DN35194_c0_g1_i3:309-1154(+)